MVLMPLNDGIRELASGLNRTVDSAGAPLIDALTDGGALSIALTDVIFRAMIQIEPVEFLCASDSGNAMTVPELNSTLLGIVGFVFSIGGLALLVLFGGASWAISKIKTGHGGGGGKGAAIAGGALLFIGIIAGSFPALSGEVYSGSEQCFAMIQPAIETGVLGS